MVRVTEKTASLELIAAPAIEKRILVVRGRRVMVDEDLADLYGVETKRLVEQVKRNVERFPADFMFQLDETEAAALRSQIATSKAGRGGRRYAPTSSPSKAWQCFRGCCVASVRLPSTSRSCGRSSSCAARPRPTLHLRIDSKSLSEKPLRGSVGTTASSIRFSRP
jgi:hypothetical protein